MCAIANPAFLRYVYHLTEEPLGANPSDRRQLEVLAAIPHAFADEEESVGAGWRVVPAASYDDWPVLEATPQRLRAALQTARRLMWANGGGSGISARDMIAADREIDGVLAVLQDAEVRGLAVNVAYVA